MMVIFGFMLNYALRVNLTIAIVDMMDKPAYDNSTVAAALTNETTTTSSTVPPPVADAALAPKFDWTEKQKQLILGSFFWGYILTELPGGRMAELVGGHRVFGHSMLWASVLTLVTPFAANMGVIALTILRAVLGFMLGGELRLEIRRKSRNLTFGVFAQLPGPPSTHSLPSGFLQWIARSSCPT